MAAASDAPLRAPRSSGEGPEAGSVEEVTRRNVERILALEASEQLKGTTTDRVAKAVTTFSGSMRFVGINALLMAGWIVVNLVLPEPRGFDPFPFSLLTLILSMEAIFLGIFVLISQNRAARVSEKRSHLDLQLNLLSEQENTKMLMMLEQIGQALDVRAGPEVEALAQDTQPEALSEQIDRAQKSSDQSTAEAP